MVFYMIKILQKDMNLENYLDIIHVSNVKTEFRIDIGS